MFDKFTNRAKQVIKLAKKEAQRLNHNYLGTEHVLLGLLKLGQGIAVNVLRNLNLDHLEMVIRLSILITRHDQVSEVVKELFSFRWLLLFHHLLVEVQEIKVLKILVLLHHV